jgi:hypothetical protein
LLNLVFVNMSFSGFVVLAIMFLLAMSGLGERAGSLFIFLFISRLIPFFKIKFINYYNLANKFISRYLSSLLRVDLRRKSKVSRRSLFLWRATLLDRGPLLVRYHLLALRVDDRLESEAL